MTSDLQREALSVLAELPALSPDVRIGQLMAHIGFLCEAHLYRPPGAPAGSSGIGLASHTCTSASRREPPGR